jgi:hypothetical protein
LVPARRFDPIRCHRRFAACDSVRFLLAGIFAFSPRVGYRI